MIVRHKLFSGIPAYYTDSETGDPLFNQRGELATDRDVDRFFKQAEPELDRLTLEMCAYHRARGEKLEQWQLDAELAAFRRTRIMEQKASA